ncbi:hypothetical protein BH11CYA1_BH11CYA1_50530 [soil metagenome]
MSFTRLRSTYIALIGFSLVLVLSSCGLLDGQGPGKNWLTDVSMRKEAFSIELVGERVAAPTPDKSVDKFLDDEIEDANLDRRKFAEIYAKALLKVKKGYTLESVNDNQIRLKPASGELESYGVENAWMEGKNIPGHRKEVMRPYLAANRNAEHADIPTKANIIPVVRGEDMLTTIGQLADQAAADDKAKGKPHSDKTIFHQSIAPGIILVLMEDSPYSLRSITVDDIKVLNIKDSDIAGEFNKHLVMRLPSKITFFGSDVILADAGGDFDSSIVLCDKIMSTVKKQVKGKLVFSVPNRSAVFFTGDSLPSSIEKIRSFTEYAAANQARPVSPLLYTWDNGKIEQYK